ncbi:uncharacterized protein LOC132553946 [Ylistrum balloti]|uniref:uncharacterized protein LOC132553946 n=1 Tax=Ylistrum balloti TaxID=509963 RepID=UPI002905ABD9|nr:uncharacterized protein LOC132553946 [Ylistrum balloti]
MSERKQKRHRDEQEYDECLRKRCARPKPDPDVYNWPKEWFPKRGTPLVPANMSALRIDTPKPKPPCHVFENTFYLQSPPKLRSELEPWKLDFDYNPDVEMDRLKKIKKTEKQLLDNITGHRKTHTERLNIKTEAEKIVDIEEFWEKTAKYNERKKKDMEIMRRVYRERDVGEPPDTNNIVEMAIDLKHKVFLKSMKESFPEYTNTKKIKQDHGHTVTYCTIPSQDTITDESRRIFNAIFQNGESDLERNWGVQVHEPEPGPSNGVSYAYKTHKKERANVKPDNCYSKHGFVRIGERTDVKQPCTVANGQGQCSMLWGGHENPRNLVQHNNNDNKVSSSSSNGENGGPDYGFKENECEDEKSGKESLPQSRMTLWFGHNQSWGYDEDEAITLWSGQNESMVTNGDTQQRDNQLTYEDKESKLIDKDEDVTLIRTVPFLYLSTDDLPHRIRTETFTFKRTSHQTTVTNDHDLPISRCIIL